MKRITLIYVEEFYGASKVCGEHLLRALSNRYSGRQTSSFDYVGLRYMNVYGPRQDDRGAYTGVDHENAERA